MKFFCKEDIQFFLIEAGRPDLIYGISEDYQPPKELIAEFIKSRDKIIPKHTDFRKSQNAKEMWRHNRPKLMKGIKAFHKSTAGKRFHRNLGNFLATKDTDGGGLSDNSSQEKMEALKALSSIRTHFYIENEYYHPLTEEISFKSLFSIAIPWLQELEFKILNNESLDTDDVEFLSELGARR